MFFFRNDYLDNYQYQMLKDLGLIRPSQENIQRHFS